VATIVTMSTLPDKGFYTNGIDADIPWPSREVAVEFRGQKFQLLPETVDQPPMIRVETSAEFTRDDAYRLVLEFLSSLAWAEQYGVVPTFGNWCTAPLANRGVQLKSMVTNKSKTSYGYDEKKPK
jgi:hypothetical protein